MILPTMTPEEKVKQMEKVKPLLHEAAMGWMNRNYKTVFKTKVFPTFYTFERTFEGMGKWTVIVIAESKAILKKDIVNVQGYQSYVVSHAKLESNNGMGIYLFNTHNEVTIMCNMDHGDGSTDHFSQSLHHSRRWQVPVPCHI